MLTTPPTLIFKLLVGLYSDHQGILKGARARPVKHDSQSLLFFPDYSKETTSKIRNFAPVLKKMTSFGLQTFLLYPARLKITYRGQIYLATRNEAEDFLLNTFHPPAAVRRLDFSAPQRETYNEMLISSSPPWVKLSTVRLHLSWAIDRLSPAHWLFSQTNICPAVRGLGLHCWYCLLPLKELMFNLPTA